MPWQTPTLREVRSDVRDAIRGSLPGADAMVPNSVLRVMSDVQGAVCHLNLQYLDWLALQLMPDTAETEWLDRHGDIWLINADGTTGRKVATLAEGTANFSGSVGGAVIPLGTQLVVTEMLYETTAVINVGAGHAPTPGPIRALDPGAAGNQDTGTALTLVAAPANIDGTATVIELRNGTDEETDEQLRARILQRIRQPPQGGAEHDYVRWTLAVPGVTRAWAAANEMGMGTVTIRFLMDELRADQDGWPTQSDIDTVVAYLNTVRPVAVKDMFVLAPIRRPVDVHIAALNPDTAEVHAVIEESLKQMLFDLAAPGQTIYSAWKSRAILDAPQVISFTLLDWTDDVMESPGHMAVLGDITYEP